MAVLAAHPCVVACLAGHAHEGWYDVDDSGIHHATLPSVSVHHLLVNELDVIQWFDGGEWASGVLVVSPSR